MSVTVKGWTRDREARARQLWKEGHSPAAIAKALDCGLSRDAVKGKLTQMGVIGGSVYRATPFAPGKLAAAPAPAPASPPPAPPTSPAVVPARPCALTAPAVADDPSPCGGDQPDSPVPLEALRSGQCKWPVTSPAPGEPHLFCGARAISGKPYCAAHHTRAYQARPKHADAAAPGPQGREGESPPALMRGTDSPGGLEARHR